MSNSTSTSKFTYQTSLVDKSVLVTGGAGFIGSNIVEKLLLNGVKFVRIIDNLATGNKKNIEHLLDKYPNLEFMYGDISNLDTCRMAVKGIDVITHQAALGSVPRSILLPLQSHVANVNGFLNILIAANEEGIKRVVYASSSSVYGDNPTLPKIEENTGSVLSPYAATKAIDEIYANVFTRCYGMECIGLRYFNIFGPRQDPNGAYAAVIPKFISLIRSGKSPVINGDGTFSRDFTHVANAVHANLLGLTTDNEDCYGEAFNIGCEGQISLNELVIIISATMDTYIMPTYGAPRAGDIPHSNADISKARHLLNYSPIVTFTIGMETLINKGD
jgi:UDP-N-acetylglucosamine/UDP-N-acetylgalactosamine 4-epimerase